jgi:hypothetical protein
VVACHSLQHRVDKKQYRWITRSKIVESCAINVARLQLVYAWGGKAGP